MNIPYEFINSMALVLLYFCLTISASRQNRGTANTLIFLSPFSPPIYLITGVGTKLNPIMLNTLRAKESGFNFILTPVIRYGLDIILSCRQKWQRQGGDLLVIQALKDSRFARQQAAQLTLVEQMGFFSSNPNPSGCSLGVFHITQSGQLKPKALNHRPVYANLDKLLQR
jgi:hypothetical protein